VRQGVTDTYNVRWFGAQRVDENPDYDIQPLIANLVNFGRLRGTIRTILIPDTGVYEYYGGIELEDGMTLRGAGGTYLATDTDEFGNTFRPVRILDDHTRLRVKDGKALEFLLMMLPKDDPNHVSPTQSIFFSHAPTVISAANDVNYMGLEDIVLDGNWEGNTDAFERRDVYGGHSVLENWLRNAPGYAGSYPRHITATRFPSGSGSRSPMWQYWDTHQTDCSGMSTMTGQARTFYSAILSGITFFMAQMASGRI
jgi:hypothetical protein